ncbi:MAG: hypothetical protein ABFS32_16450 [Bacteroidota bacterium]
MINKHIVILIFALIIIGCNRRETEPPFCNVEDPINELAWLNEIIHEDTINGVKTIIFMCQYKEEEGFLLDICVGCYDPYARFMNCSGEVICHIGGYANLNTCPDFWENVTDKELLWESE